jgi:hypothetical protein
MEIELTAVEDEKVIGTGRRHFIFPDKPKGVDRALLPLITGGIWIKRDTVVPEKVVITIKQSL